MRERCKKTETLRFRVHPGMVERLENAAAREKMPPADLMRTALLLLLSQSEARMPFGSAPGTQRQQRAV